MAGTIAPYLMAVSAMLFAGASALTLIHTVRHLDPPDADLTPDRHPIDDTTAASVGPEVEITAAH